MKFTKVFWLSSLGWIMLSGYIFMIKFVYLENWNTRWSFTRPVFEMSQLNPPRNVKSRVIHVDSSSIFYSVKSTPAYYKSRLDVLKTTWFQVVDRDKLSIVSDYLNDSYHEEKRFEAELIGENFKLVLARCIIAHGKRGLCCKSGTEYKQFYDYLKNHSDGKNQVKWYCHFDDDVYVNVKELSKLLSQYNSSKPYYIGRNPRGPNGVKVDQYRLNSLKKNYHVNKTNYLYAAGAAYCNSLGLMKELYEYFSNPKRFGDTCERTKTTDDLTVGAIIEMVLNHTLTNIETMHFQGISLKQISMANLTKMITVSYNTDRKDRQKIMANIDPKPRIFTTLQDPTRFLTFHCSLYNKTSWCQASSQIPSNLMSSRTNVSTSGDKTSNATVNPGLSQTSDQKLLQGSTTAVQSDLQSQKAINETKATNTTSGLQKLNHSDLYQSAKSTKAAADIQDYVNKAPTNDQTNSHNLKKTNDEASQAVKNHVDSLVSNQILTQQSQTKKAADNQTDSNI